MRKQRQRKAVRLHERVQQEATARVLVEESTRAVSEPSRINNALSDVQRVVNDTMQTPESWRKLWSS